MSHFRSPFTVDGVPTKGGGAPTRFYGWFGTSWFIDYDHGNDAYDGKAPVVGSGSSGPMKNLRTLLIGTDASRAAGPDDVIYIRGRDASTGTDPLSITPATAANWNIPRSLYGLALIGASGVVGAQGQVRRTTLQGHASVTTSTVGSSVLTVSGSYTALENLTFARGGTTRALVDFYSDGTATYNGFGSSLYNCLLRLHNQNAFGALQITDTWEIGVYGCQFDRNKVAIRMDGSSSTIERIYIGDNDFRGDPAAVDCYIVENGSNPDYIIVHGNRFASGIPAVAGGVFGKYIIIPTATTLGLVSDNYFGKANVDPAADLTLGTRVLQVGNWDVAGIVV